MKRILALSLIVCLVLCAGAAWWFLPGRRAEVRLSSRPADAAARSAFAVEPIYLQTDPRWSSEKVGGSGESIRSVGCTLCCLSMALAHHGIDLNPAALNRKLKDADGYTYRGWIKWDAVGRVTGGKVRVLVPSRPADRDLAAALDASSPVLVKVLLRSGVQHWVLLVGRDRDEYLMKDPLGDGKTLGNLSSLGSDILAVRIIQRTRDY